MNNFKKNIYKSANTELPLIEYSFKRDGSQNCAGFHIPYVDYLDEFGDLQTEYLSECSDDCSTIYASSIIDIVYSNPC